MHELLDLGQTLLLCGAEINRVEDTMTRLGRAYGAHSVDIFVITSDIVLTIQFPDGSELTQTRRINQPSSTDFSKLEQLNALSRACCQSPLPLDELQYKLGHKDIKSTQRAAGMRQGRAGRGRALLVFEAQDKQAEINAAILAEITGQQDEKNRP